MKPGETQRARGGSFLVGVGARLPGLDDERPADPRGKIGHAHLVDNLEVGAHLHAGVAVQAM